MTTFSHTCSSFEELQEIMSSKKEDHKKRVAERVKAIMIEIKCDEGTAYAIEKVRRVNSEVSN